MKAKQSRTVAGRGVDPALALLELYYPIHYKAGIGVEDALRGGELSRHQVAILWLIHSEGEGGVSMSRKAIVASLASWFEISNAAITKALRGMAAEPLSLLTLDEDPSSGREKVVTLTAKGEAHLEQMMRRGAAYIQAIIDHMTKSEVASGTAFFQRISDIVDRNASKESNG